MKAKPENKLSAVFVFTENGFLKKIMLNAETEKDQETLERALNRILKPLHFSWVRRLFR